MSAQPRPHTRRHLLLMMTSVCCVMLLGQGVLYAQEDEQELDPWEDKLPTDRPGLADTSSALNPRDLAVEFGLSALKPAVADFAAAMSLSVRFGLFEGVETRVRIPSFGFALAPNSNSFEMAFNAIEAGVKLSIPLHSTLRLALVPTIIVPPSDIQATGYAGPGAALGAIVDFNPVGSLNFTFFATPKWLNLKSATDPDGESAFELESSVMVSGGLSQRMSLFFEVIGVKPALGTFYPGADFGILYYFSPDVMLDMSAGLTLEETTAAFGSLGVSFRL